MLGDFLNPSTVLLGNTTVKKFETSLTSLCDYDLFQHRWRTEIIVVDKTLIIASCHIDWGIGSKFFGQALPGVANR
jgi:hypothetical protein